MVITENSGGLGFRQSNPDWSIAAHLLIGPENNGFNWEIKYNSNSAGQKGFSVNAKITVKILADYFLQKADSLAKLIKEDDELVYVSGKFIDSNGKADRWSYYYKSMSNQEAYNYYTESGNLYLSNEVETQSVIDYMLSLDKLPDNWINSDIFITYAEQEGGTQFRQANPDWTINAYLREHNRFSEFHWQVQTCQAPKIIGLMLYTRNRRVTGHKLMEEKILIWVIPFRKPTMAVLSLQEISVLLEME